MLIIPSLISKMGRINGLLPQILGFIFLLLIPIYTIILIRQYKNNPCALACDNVFAHNNAKNPKVSITVIMIIILAFIVSLSASGLVRRLWQ
jgi:hypothetical protein